MSFCHSGSNVGFEKVCLGCPRIVQTKSAEELGITSRYYLVYKAYMGDLLSYLDLL